MEIIIVQQNILKYNKIFVRIAKKKEASETILFQKYLS